MADSTPQPKLATLITADGKESTGKHLALPREGLALSLSLADGEELHADSRLWFKPPVDANGLVLEPLNAAVSSDGGPFSNTKAVVWLLADWGVERPLTAIKLDTAAPGKARVKVFSHGGWSPLYPMDLIATGSHQSFNPVLAEKVLIELVKAGQYAGLWEPDAKIITALSLYAAPLPTDVCLSIAGQSAEFRIPGLLPSVEVAVDGFAAAVNAYLASPKATRPVPLRLSAGLPGQVQLQFSPTPVTVLSRLDGLADNALPVFWQEQGGAAQASLNLPAQAVLNELSFAVVAKLLPEALWFPPQKEPSGRAQLVTPLDRVAQGFHTDPQGPPLSGLDLKLRRRSMELEATLSLHPDWQGHPAPTPYGGAVFPIHWPVGADDLDADGWQSVTLPRPVQLPDADWWAVLTVQQGLALWDLAQQPTEGVGSCLYRKGGSVWFHRGETVWAQTRLRVATTEPGNPTVVALQRGEQQVSLPIAADGRVRADPASLDMLNRNLSAGLEIRIEAAAAGRISLLELRAVYR